MKKHYKAPEILFEDFALSDSIAGTCDGIVGNPSKGSCAVLGTGGISVFSEGIRGCDFKPEDLGGINDEWDGFCYHVPTEYNNLFNS